ncbi:patellin-5-like [Solanum stenotomum]|uniref:patellin-5-like n=1 Tax=Solanum stenotomum TaxID=172797 RepID=UPI0020D1C505|nr:patellin-5-like [Solanum stenotomum]
METFSQDSLAALLMAPNETLPLQPQPPPSQIVNDKISQYATEKLKYPLKLDLENTFFDTLLSPVEEMRRMLSRSLQEKVTIWGIPLLKDNRTDVVLLKFLKARDFQVDEAFDMLRKTIVWRKEFNVDKLVMMSENDVENVMLIHGKDKEGSLVFYCNMMFIDKENLLRCWIQLLEKSIRKLDFSPVGNTTLLQVIDVKNFSGCGFNELRIATTQTLQDNYPQLVTKQVFINIPGWYMGFHKMISPFLSKRTKEKFAFASASESAETLLNNISPEHLPVQFGGISNHNFDEDNKEFTNKDPATLITLKPRCKQAIEILVNHNERCLIRWELRVVGWEVKYCAEYVPRDECAYSIIVQKARKIFPSDEQVISGCFYTGCDCEGKMVLTIDNPTSNNKKVIYRSKVTLCHDNA